MLNREEYAMANLKTAPPTPPYPADFHVDYPERGHGRLGSDVTQMTQATHVITASTAPFAEHGLGIDRSPTKEQFVKKKSANPGLRWPRIRRAYREALSEFMGTFILILFGNASIAQVVLSKDTHGDYQSISWGWVCFPGRSPWYDQTDHLLRALDQCSESMSAEFPART